MQNKGAITLLAILLALVSLYQLSFTLVTNMVRNDAIEYAQGNPEKEAEYLDSIASEEVYNFLWLRQYTYRECQNKEVNLGLDLKGGMNVTLEISVVDLLKAMAGPKSEDSTFVKSLRLAKEKRRGSQEDFIDLFGEAFHETAPENAKLSAIFHHRETKELIPLNAEDAEVIAILKEEAKSAIDNSFNVLRNRIDRFGVSQPNIQRLENTAGRILVELPGVKDPKRVRKLLEGTAKLEFYETFDNVSDPDIKGNRGVYHLLAEIDQKLAQEKGPIGQETGQTDTIAADTLANDTAATEIAEDTDTTGTDEDSAVADAGADDTTDLMTEVGQQDTTGMSQEEQLTQFRKEHPLFAYLHPSVNDQQQLVKGATVGYAQIRDTAKINAFLRRPDVQQVLPRTMRLLWEHKPFNADEGGTALRLIAIKMSIIDGQLQPPMEGDVITDAREDFGQNSASPSVSMSMNGEGAKIWARMTRDNVGKQVAIVLDDQVYSFPVVNQEIKGGRTSIEGQFTINEAKDLANVLKSGKMPAPAHIIEEEIVGPSLGQEAIDAGMSSFLIAFLVIMLYMMFYYSRSGIVSDIALLANIFFIFGVLASLQAVLTLPGIAGIVLTIGMSVDANVLIYERIREELRVGKGLRLAISDGYKNAYSAIVDANVTTLLTGIILLVFGHGPIKGFAVTLVIGILTSLFSAIFITRLIFMWMLKRDKKITFATRMTENFFKNTNVQFLKNRKVAYVISGIIILVGIVSLVTRGLDQGVDFVGGRTYTVRFEKPVQATDVAKALKPHFDGQLPEVKTFGADGMKITTKYLIDDEGAEVDSIVEHGLYAALRPMLSDKDVSYDQFLSDYRVSSQKVGPTIADDIKVSAVYSVIFALIIMFLYIFIRFKNWQFGLGAVAALAHDTLVVLGLFSIFYGILPFSMEIDQAFIAAILTVVGYSINDTVVVFDRIREFLGLHKKTDPETVYNNALNSTLSRTVSTSLSTFFVLLTIFIFGGEVIRGFIFALLVGVVVGTYSSLFIATPVVFDMVSKKLKVEPERASKHDRRKARRKKSETAE